MELQLKGNQKEEVMLCCEGRDQDMYWPVAATKGEQGQGEAGAQDGAYTQQQ
jgi:hypothetical protein